MKTKILFCLLVTLSVFTAFGQSGAEWNAYKRANGIDPRYTYNAWVAAGMPRGGGGNNGGGYSGPSAADIAAQQAAIAAQQKKEADAHAANNDGLKAYKNEDWDTAADDFQKALQIFPNNQVYLKNLAQTQARQGEKAQEKNDNTTAIDYFQKALANDPNDQDIRESLDTAKYLVESSERGKTMADNERQSIQKIAQNINTTTAAGGLDFDGDHAANPPNGGNGLDMTPTTPASDPMVVDARNVPSGLPKSVDAAIPHTPAGDRMRKGYEAIQDGDWKVALAWFQDALNKEPGDPDLQRLVDLAQFTLIYRSQPQTILLPDQNSTIKSADDAAVKSSVDPIANAAASQAAAQARAKIAFDQYVTKYGDGHVIERSAAVSAAMRGEGFTKEELKAQLQQALKDYHKKHNPADENMDLGPATLDEIIIGGKG